MRSAFCIAVAAAAVVVSVVAVGSISNYNVKTTLSDAATESAGTEPGPTGAATLSNPSPQLIFGEPVVSGVMKQSHKQRINERLEQSKCAQHENDGRRRGSRRGLVYRGPDHTAAAGAPDDAASCTGRRGISHSSSDPPSSSGNSRLLRAATLLAEEEQTNPAGPSKYQLQPQPSQHQQQQRPTPPSNAAKQPRPASTSDAFGTVQQKKADSPETTVPSSSPSLAPSLGVPNTADEAQQSLEPEVLPTPKEKDASFKHVLPPSPARHHPAADDDEDAVQHGGKGGKQQGGQVPKTDAQQQPQTRAEKQASMLELADRAAQEAES
eukprot:gene5216-22324_t